MFRGDLFATIAEISMLILDVCVCLYKIFLGYLKKKFFYRFSLKRLKMVCPKMTMLLKSLK